MALKPLGGMLKKNLANKGALTRIESTLILAEFEKVIVKLFGESFRNICEPTYFKDGILAVSCNSSVVMQELKLREAMTICELNKILGDKVVKEIKVFR